VGLIEDSHPDPFLHAGGRVAFFRTVAAAANELPDGSISRGQLARVLLPVVAAVGDGHTTLGSGEAGGPGLPIDLVPVGDQMFVSAVYRKKDRDLLGGRLVAVGGQPLGALLERMSTLQGHDDAWQNRVNLAQGLHDDVVLGMLLASPGDEVHVQVKGRTSLVDRALPRMKTEDDRRIVPPSRIELPDPDASDIGWGFIGPDQQIAYLRIVSMMRYREAFELWRATGYVSNLGEHLDRTVRATGARSLPDDRDARIAAVPSATEAMRSLTAEMSARGVDKLIIDLRANHGGNSAITYIVGTFLAGLEATASQDDGYQLRRFSQLYLDTHTAVSLDDLAKDGLVIGEYDFSGERRWRDHPGVGGDIAELTQQLASFMPTFAAVLADPPEPLRPRMIVLTSASTYSAGFDLARLLRGLGATVVGVASAQAGNCYIDTMPFRLDNSGLQGSISSKLSLAWPDDPALGKVLEPDVVLGVDDMLRLEGDPNATVLLALDRFAGD
ncbi:MAG: hypothetical protein GXP62_13610, partial [Oligoflexia bacterium]|nr:hypothetical protein [Oligoflexia bacterium]